MLDLPTDSLPLVLALDSLDLLNCSGAVNPIAVIPTKLQAYVKIVVTLDSENRASKYFYSPSTKSQIFIEDSLYNAQKSAESLVRE